MKRQARILVATVLLWWWGVANVFGQGIPAPPAVPAAPAAPAVPGAPGVPGATPGSVPGAADALGKRNIWDSICPTEEQCARCKKKFCNSIFGTLFDTLLKPATLYSGGLLKPCCPTPDQANPADLEKPADSPDGAAARIKKDEAEAKARRANVRYLSTADCSRWPEAEKALILALRTDRNECVRWEAAMALGNGCCCTKKTIEALRLTAIGSDKDGNPIESSQRVRAEAARSLTICEHRVEYRPEPPERPVPLPDLKKAALLGPPSGVQPTSFTEKRLPPITNAPPKPAPQQQEVTASNASTDEPEVRSRNGQRGLFDIFRRSFQKANP